MAGKQAPGCVYRRVCTHNRDNEEFYKDCPLQDGIDSRYPVAVICNETATACADALPHSNRNTSEAYMMQNFYTIYVHTKPDFPGYPEGSLFHKREVPAPIQVLPHLLRAAPAQSCMCPL